MLNELCKYLKILFEESNRFERTDINNKENNSFVARYGIRILFFIITVMIISLTEKGFSDDFISFVSSVLSILVGLFITALIFSFDKFYEPKKSEQTNSRINLWHTQAYNYAKKFAYITSKTIILSIITLVALILSTLFEDQFALNIFAYSFIDSREQFWSGVGTALIIIANLVQRFIVLYFLLLIMYNTVFIVASMVQYMTTKMDRH